MKFLGWILFATLFSTISAGADDSAPVKIEAGLAQLFIDDYLIDSQENLERTLHQPTKDHGGNIPIIALPQDAFGELPATLEANGSIVYDPNLKKMVMYALAFCSSLGDDRRWEKVRLYRFTSDDGLSWSDSEWVFPRSREDFLNRETGEYATNIDLFSCYYDDKDTDYPYKGLCWFANWGLKGEGSYLLKSKDGILWERGPLIVDGCGGEGDTSMREIHQDGRTLVGAGDVTLVYKDPLRDRLLGIFKFTSPTTVENGNRLRSRAYAFMDTIEKPFDIESIDHIEFLPPAQEEGGDHPHDEYYASTGWRYESLWLGGLKVWHGQGDYPYSAAGCAYLKLAVSRDGLHWSKVPFKNGDGYPEVFIPNGPEGGNDGHNDGGYITEHSTGPIVSGDELIYYYGCSSYGKNHGKDIRLSGGGIFRGRLRMDGFVSVEGGSLTTKPLKFEGEDLTLNSVGSNRIEVLSESGEPLGSAQVNGDSIHHHVLFGDKTLGELADGNPVGIKFDVLDGGKVYSFTVH
ncbi:MAG: hypothetical protein KC931_00595 [Candidatus Omnitrophica bacterium]|nr:hypothetical protein [Candidatus Omnitrophota bacterium]